MDSTSNIYWKTRWGCNTWTTHRPEAGVSGVAIEQLKAEITDGPHSPGLWVFYANTRRFMMLVTYEGNGEVLICAVENEKQMLEEWFVQGGRHVRQYGRHEAKLVVRIKVDMDVRLYN